MSNQVLKSALIVLAFWGFVFSIYYGDGSFDYRLAAQEAGLGVVFFTLSVFLSNGFREKIYVRLGPDEVNGLVSAMGPVPIHRKTLAHAPKINATAYYRSVPAELDGLDPFATYSGAYAESHPHYVALYEAILRVYTSPEHIKMPATYSRDATSEDSGPVNANAHGGRSLLEHCLLVSGVAMRTWSHFSEKYKPENRARMNDPEFQPQPNDPLAPLIAIAHDLGKLGTFRTGVVDNGKVVATKVAHNHDLVGAELLAEIPEFWNAKIPFDERAIIQNVLAVYHHPHALPIAPVEGDADGKYKYRSDRERVLLEHLIYCDLTASKIESGKVVNLYAEAVTQQSIDESNEPVADFKTSFFQFLVSHGLSNSRGKSLGFKAVQNDRQLVVFDQNVFLDAFSDHLGKPYIKESQPKHQVNPVVGNILQFLDDFGVVFRALGEQKRSPETCIYETQVINRDGVNFLTINYGFVLDVTDAEEFSFLRGLPESAASFNFLKCKFGDQGTKRSSGISTDFKIVREELLGLPAPEGLSLFDLIKTNPPKQNAPRKKKKMIDADTLRLKIAYAIKKGDLVFDKKWKKDDHVFAAIKGQDQWFIDMGFPPASISEEDKLKLNITSIKPSETVPGQHVIVLRPDQL